jgi:hypothetical protein
MRALILIAGAALALAACDDPANHHMFYHMRDGRTAYNDNGVWYYLIATQPLLAPDCRSGSSLGLGGQYATYTFQHTSKPTFSELNEAEEERAPVMAPEQPS